MPEMMCTSANDRLLTRGLPPGAPDPWQNEDEAVRPLVGPAARGGAEHVQGGCTAKPNMHGRK
eukprot:9001156-Alexandrium_andersonii.AAC.1